MKMTTHIKLRRSPTEEQKIMIKNAFTLFDSDSDGCLDYFELKAGLRALGFPVKKAEVLKILDTYDKINRKFICFDDFYSVARDKIIRRDPREEICYAFRLFLHDDETSIGYRDLQRVVDILGLDISPDEIEGMINEFDADNDGRINEEEFMAIMLNTY